MKLSYKATQFIIEAIDCQIEAYQKCLEEIEDEDDASDIGNDCGFLEALRKDFRESLKQGELPQGLGSVESEGLSWQELAKLIKELSINDRLFLVDAINESIREEISEVKTAISSV